ncbi:YbaB/EbfC family nucleoid-associated protein [Prauserella cavernicola]|uniref:YbaB/EbfC family nucleoid-associated protein n=1 Tax=Prauserella cavernicola TaxID=2800127 RepID=A0A934V4X3_9PSEU|nr:YbaB/EbfC family nucleoid-associated protein [Prauserella cavernicola]MBK1784048.1 YbaB/EbfC family nucleoid-associated protein [Prauserella cavernicola]
MSAEFEQLVAEFEKFQSKIKKVDDQLADLGQMQNAVAELEGMAVSADRSVTVVAGPGGALKDIQLTDKAMEQQPKALAAALLSTVQQAVADAARKQAAIVEEHMGSGLGLSDRVVESQAQLFGKDPEQFRAEVAEGQPRTRSAEEEHHDDYSEQSVFDDADDRGKQAPPPPASGSSAGDAFLQNLFDNDDRR